MAIVSDSYDIYHAISEHWGKTLREEVIASGASTPWTVPVHVLSRDPGLVAPFAGLGYAAGVAPPDGAANGMESFLPDFVKLFSDPGRT